MRFIPYDRQTDSNGLRFPESSISSNAPLLKSAGRALGDSACSLADGCPCLLTAEFIEVVVRTSANEVVLETANRRSPTVGSNEVSSVVLGHRAHSLVGLLGTLRRLVCEETSTPVAPVDEQVSLQQATQFASFRVDLVLPTSQFMADDFANWVRSAGRTASTEGTRARGRRQTRRTGSPC